jgi:hypothetical protein
MTRILENTNHEQSAGQPLRDALSNLDDRQLVSLIQQLVDERDSLLKRQEHMASLSKLWEKTIAEAENIAEQVKEEARKQSAEEASVTISNARASAEQLLSEQLTKSTNSVKDSVQSAKSKWKQELEAISVTSIKAYEDKLTDTARRITDTFTANIESLKEQSTFFRKELEQKLAEMENHPAITTENTTTPVIEQQNPQPIATVQTTVPDKTQNAAAVRVNEDELSLGQAIIEILPPRDKDRIENIRKHLDTQEEVVLTEITHLVDRTFITVALAKFTRSADLMQIMSDWPEIEEMQEKIVDNQYRIQIKLGVEREIAREKDKLNARFGNITHRIKPGVR